jgi:hypothetical protein
MTSTPCRSSAPTILSQSQEFHAALLLPASWEDRAADLEPPDVPCSQAWTRVRFRTGGVPLLGRRRWLRHAHASHAIDRGTALPVVQSIWGAATLR